VALFRAKRSQLGRGQDLGLCCFDTPPQREHEGGSRLPTRAAVIGPPDTLNSAQDRLAAASHASVIKRSLSMVNGEAKGEKYPRLSIIRSCDLAAGTSGSIHG